MTTADFCAYCFGPLATGRNLVDEHGVAYCTPEHQQAAAKPIKGLPRGGMVDVGGHGGALTYRERRGES